MDLIVDFPKPVAPNDLKPGDLFVGEGGRRQYIALRCDLGDKPQGLLLSAEPGDAMVPHVTSLEGWDGLRRIDGRVRLLPPSDSFGREDFDMRHGSIRLTPDGDVQMAVRFGSSMRLGWVSLLTGKAGDNVPVGAVNYANWRLVLERGEGRFAEQITLAERSIIDMDPS